MNQEYEKDEISFIIKNDVWEFNNSLLNRVKKTVEGYLRPIQGCFLSVRPFHKNHSSLLQNIRGSLHMLSLQNIFQKSTIHGVIVMIYVNDNESCRTRIREIQWRDVS